MPTEKPCDEHTTAMFASITKNRKRKLAESSDTTDCTMQPGKKMKKETRPDLGKKTKDRKAPAKKTKFKGQKSSMDETKASEQTPKTTEVHFNIDQSKHVTVKEE